MNIDNRPKVLFPDDSSQIQSFISSWQEAIDTGNANLFNKGFAEDVLWGSPFGAIANGYEQIHAVHERMFSSVTAVKGAAKFKLEHAKFLTDTVAIAFVRRVSQQQQVANQEVKPGCFDELALLVFVKQSGQWWLAAAQHVPDKRDIYSNK